MPWGRLDDGLYDHPKLDLLGRDRLAAVGLWTLAISWCNRRLTDGVVPLDRIRLLGGTTAIADRLVEAGLFERHPDGYGVHDFLTFNDSRETVEARREADRNRKRTPHRKPNGLHADSTPDSGGFPRGVQPETERTPSSRASARAGRVAPAGGRPDPAYTESRPSDSPKSPPSGDHDEINPRASGANPRALGTSPRQIAAEKAIVASRAAEARRSRRAQRELAYHRGAINEQQLREMNQADAPLEDLPDWVEHQERLHAEAAGVPWATEKVTA